MRLLFFSLCGAKLKVGFLTLWRRGSLIISVLSPGWSGPASSTGHCDVFFGKTLYSHSASLHTDVCMGTGKFNARVNPVVDWHPTQGGWKMKYSLLLHATETVISYGLTDHLARMQTSPFYLVLNSPCSGRTHVSQPAVSNQFDIVSKTPYSCDAIHVDHFRYIKIRLGSEA